MKLRAAYLLLLFPLLLCAPNARADQIPLGVLSFGVFIPDGSGTPRVNGFDMSTLRGAFRLPPDFRVATGLTLLNATLTVNRLDGSQSQGGLHE